MSYRSESEDTDIDYDDSVRVDIKSPDASSKADKKARRGKGTKVTDGAIPQRAASTEKDIEFDVNAEDDRRLYSYNITERSDLAQRRNAVDYTGTGFAFARTYTPLRVSFEIFVQLNT